MDDIKNTEVHPLLPFLPEKAKLLMLGSFPPPRKRWSMDFYYPNLQNDMWRIFGAIYFTDPAYFLIPDRKAFDQPRIEAFAREIGLALFDTASEVRRLQENASDKFLEVVTPTDVVALLHQLPYCKALVVTGQKAMDVIRGQLLSAINASGDLVLSAEICPEPKIGDSIEFLFGDRKLRLYRMPSSSRAYPLSLDKKAAYYRKMLQELSLLSPVKK
ncbi:MAG: uracil-DNA glycosylase family protein [Bacteroidaceae bacterium]